MSYSIPTSVVSNIEIYGESCKDKEFHHECKITLISGESKSIKLKNLDANKLFTAVAKEKIKFNGCNCFNSSCIWWNSSDILDISKSCCLRVFGSSTVTVTEVYGRSVITNIFASESQDLTHEKLQDEMAVNQALLCSGNDSTTESDQSKEKKKQQKQFHSCCSML